MKITIVRNTRKKVSGVEHRCGEKHPITHAQCLRPANHPARHQWTPRKENGKTIRPSKKRTLSLETKLSCLEMIEDPIYRVKLLEDLRRRDLRPAVECMLWYYAKGKPKEMVEHSGTLTLQQELASLSPEQLRERALAVAKMLGAPTVH